MSPTESSSDAGFRRALVLLFLGDATLAAALALAVGRFAGANARLPEMALAFGGFFSAGSRLLRWGLIRLAKCPRAWAGRFGLVAAAFAASWLTAEPTQPTGRVVWLAVATTVLACLLRQGLGLATRRWQDADLELPRWILLLGGGVALFWPFWQAGGLGSGDATWYTLMIADFAAQWNAGSFPVWAGQSLYAYNGAINPLALAPLLQHGAGVIDLVSLHALTPAALKNAMIATMGLGIVFSGYFSLRVICPRRPSLACALALIWAASPGILVPIMMEDMYLSAAAMIFVPIVFAALWTIWRDDGLGARLALAGGLAGAFLGHPPIATWLALGATIVVLVKFALSRDKGTQVRLALITLGAFIALGSLPFVGAAATPAAPHADFAPLILSNLARLRTAVFAPLTPAAATTIQPGLSAAGLFVLGLLLAIRHRVAGLWIFILATLLITVLVVPVPTVTAFLWSSMPKAFIYVQNQWPYQRLTCLWAFAAVATFAAAAAQAPDKRPGLVAQWIVVIAGVVWSGSQAHLVLANVAPDSVSAVNRILAPGNLVIGHPSYLLFPQSPDSESQGYTDPLLENRLLDLKTQTVLATNADAAAPHREDSAEEPRPVRLISSGSVTAINDNHSHFYNLSPALPAPVGQLAALRLEFLGPPLSGYLQLKTDRLWREYPLPDSGYDSGHVGPPAAFGTLPTSGRVIPLGRIEGAQPLAPVLILPQRPITAQFPAGRYWLYTYEPKDLPVAVYSLIPYKADVNAPVAAWVETPRMWQPGYTARVDKRPAAVEKSPQGRVMVAVPAGHSNLRVDFSAPAPRQLAYYLAMISWLAWATYSYRRLSQPTPRG